MKLFAFYMVVIMLIVFAAYETVQGYKAQYEKEKQELIAKAEEPKREEVPAPQPKAEEPKIEEPKTEPVKQEVAAQPEIKEEPVEEVHTVNNVVNNYYVDNSTNVNYNTPEPETKPVQTREEDMPNSVEVEQGSYQTVNHYEPEGGRYERMDYRRSYSQPRFRVLVRQLERTPEGYRRAYLPPNADRRYQNVDRRFGRVRWGR